MSNHVTIRDTGELISMCCSVARSGYVFLVLSMHWNHGCCGGAIQYIYSSTYTHTHTTELEQYVCAERSYFKLNSLEESGILMLSQGWE